MIMNKEFKDFQNCNMTTSEILNIIKSFDNKKDFIKYLYVLLFNTDIKIENERDLHKIISAYLGYKDGNYVTMSL